MRTAFRLSLFLCLATFISASAQIVRFDVQPLGECYDWFDPEFEQLHPGERLIQIPLEIAAEIGLHDADSVDALIFQAALLDRQLNILDFSPRKVSDSEIEGLISVEQSSEASASLGAKATAPATPWLGTAETHAGLSGKNSEAIRFHRKPPQYDIVSSGYFGRRTGVFVKLRRTEQISLEGIHQINLIVRVPYDWRTGFLRVTCTSISRHSQVFGDSDTRLDSQVTFLIPLMMSHDQTARAAAQTLRQAEDELRRRVHTALEKKKKSDPFSSVRHIFPAKNGLVPGTQWLETTLTTIDPDAAEPRELSKDLAISWKDLQYHRQRFAALSWDEPVVLQRRE